MASLRTLDPALRPWAEALVEVARQRGLRPIVTSAYRTMAQQRVLYDRYIQGRSAYPAARPGYSTHEWRLAFDMVSSDNAQLGRIWRSWGGKWTPHDAVHFQPHVR